MSMTHNYIYEIIVRKRNNQFITEAIMVNINYEDTIGGRMRKARKDKNLTLIDMYNKIGISTGNLSDLENNKSLPSAAALVSLSRELNVTIDWLLIGDNITILNKIFDVNSEVIKNNSDLVNEILELIKELPYCLLKEIKEFIQFKIFLMDFNNRNVKSGK
jgi:HTH-type transcriptional regulator, cell division transcriptional repressor